MFDSVKILTNVMNVNLFTNSDELTIHEGSYPVTFTIRLYQSDRKDRYMPDATTTVRVEFLRADTVAQVPVSQTVIKTLNRAYPTSDGSIWSCQLTQADILKIVSGGFRVTIVEGTSPSAITTVVYNKMSIRKLPSSDDVFA